MAFCSRCGAQMPDSANFCGSCGTTFTAVAGGGASGGSSYQQPPYQQPPYQQPPQQAYAAPVHDPLDYTIVGDNLQIARIRLNDGQEVYAEAGKMIYKTANVNWDTRMTGQTIGDKILGAIRRTVSGQSLFVTYFRANGPGEVGFAGSYPGKIQAIDLGPGQVMLAQRDAFLLAQPTIQLSVAFTKKLGAGFFGGEGFILEKLIGPGLVFIHAGGDFVEFTLGPGQTIQVETGCIVAFEEAVTYDIQFVGGIKTAIFGGEGLFLASLTGPGRVILQSMTLQKMRRELAPQSRSNSESHGIGALGNLFTNDDQ